MDPQIRFCTSSDGVRIAYTVFGEGPPLVMTPGWVSHQEMEWQGPSGEFSRRLAQNRRLVLFDGRGTVQLPLPSLVSRGFMCERDGNVGVA